MEPSEPTAGFDEMAVSLLEQGNEVNTVLALLKERGATAADCISALNSIGIEQKDSQRLVASSPAWAELFNLARANKRD